MRCPFTFGKHRCGAALEEIVDRLGRVSWVCHLCARRQARICRDCPARVAGRHRLSMRCDRCRNRKVLRDAKKPATHPAHERKVRNLAARRRRDKRRGGPLTDAIKREIGRKRGLARAAALTPERRREIAMMGFRARFPEKAC